MAAKRSGGGQGGLAGGGWSPCRELSYVQRHVRRSRSSARRSATTWPRTVRALPRPRGARRRATRTCAAPTPSSTPRSTQLARGLLALGLGRATGSASGARTAPSGSWRSTPRRAIGVDPRQHQPGVPHPRGGVRPAAVGLPACCCRPPSSRRATTRAMVAEVAPRAPDARDGRLPRHARLGRRCWRRPRACRPTTLASARGRLQLRRPDQHPVHERHDRLPEGRHAQPPQHPEQRLLHRRGLRLHRGRPGLHPRALLPLLRDGARATSACTTHGAAHRRPGARVRARRHAARPCRTSGARASTACRRCSSPSWRCPTSRTLRPLVAAHRASWPARRARSR